MNYKVLGVLLTAFIISMCVAIGQQRNNKDAHITGHIIDKQTKEHVPYATVAIKGTTIATLADASGHFLLTNITPGKHTVEAAMAGYKAAQINVDVEPNKTTEVKFELEPQALELDQVVVTGNRNETNKRESSTIVNVVSDKLFTKTASNNVAEVLNYQPGLRVEYNCSNCGVPQLRINGLEGQYSQILLDSRPIFSSLATVYGLEQLPVGMIERVEVIRGGGSALFGSNAIAGVVNIITKEPIRNSVMLGNVTSFYENGGADVNTTLNASLVTDDHKAGIYMYGLIKNRDSYDRNGDGFSEIPKVESETVGFRGYYKLSSSSKLTAEYHHIREFRRGGNLMNRPPHEADIAEQLRHRIDGGGLKYDFMTEDRKHKLSVYTSLQSIDRDSYFGTNQNPDAYGKTTDLTFVGGAQYAYSFDNLWFMPATLTVGGEYSQNLLNDQMLGYNRTIAQNSITYGGYLQNEWRNSHWGILLGGRLDKHNKVKNAIFSPRVNIRYSPSEMFGFRLSYASGYRAPQAYEEDLHVAAVAGEVAIITIDPNLRPEYSNSISGSIDFYHKIGSIELNLLVEGFYTDLRDVFILVENGHDEQGNLLLERRNASGATIAGVNFELKAGLAPRLILDAGFTLQQSRYKEPLKWSKEQSLEPQRRMFRSPDKYGFATLNYTPFTGFSASASVNYTGQMLVQHYAGYVEKDTQKLTPDFWDMGLRFAYDLKVSKVLGIQLSCGVKNVFDAFQSDIDKGVNRDAGYIYGPAMPRTYFVGLKMTL